ncbi:MAG TPA: hypothetical protein VKR58_02130, partial [Aquella sp.]|nr:hypothetical protein [Aquella sp.]
DNLERKLNALTKIKLRTDYKKIFIISEIYLLHNLPKELVKITYQMIYSRTLISAGIDNIILNTSESHIFCRKLWDMHQIIDINKMIPSRIKQLFILDKYFISLSMNGVAYFRKSIHKCTIYKNIKYICEYGNYSSDFFLPNITHRIKSNAYYLLKDDHLEITDGHIPFEMISCGKYHMMYLLKDGTIYAEGDNWFGQLGINNANYVGTNPVKVDIHSKISHVCCGKNFTVLKTTDDKILMYGNFYKIKSDVYGKVKIIGCSKSYAIALTDHDYLYIWGYNWYQKIYMAGVIEIGCHPLYIMCIRYDETVKVITLTDLDKIRYSDSEDFF